MKRKLVNSKAKNACPKADGRPQNLTDGGGLFLHVSTGGKYWRYNYRFQGKAKTLAIGVYPNISLKQARELLARGIDPSSHKKAQKNLQAALNKNSFEAIAREYHRKFLPTWQKSYADKMMGYFEKDVFPWIGASSIAEIEAPEIIKEANLTSHYIPLSSQAVEILQDLFPLTGRSRGGYLFPSIRTPDKPMSNNTVNAALRRMGYTKTEMTGHGFRSMASTLFNGMKGADGKRRWDKEAIERQLAHKDTSIRGIYNHQEHLDEWREMLQV